MSDIPDFSNVDSELLEHYGVKGMKWGVRRDQATLDRLAGRRTAKREAKKAAKAPSPDAQKARELQAKAKKRGTNTLSNNELKELNKRLNLEKSYREMTTPKKSGGNRKASQFEKMLVEQGMDFLMKMAFSKVKSNYGGRNTQVANALAPRVIDVDAKRNR